MNKLPKRKSVRIPEYDYSRNGAYFVTICVDKMQKVLSKIEGGMEPVGANIVRPKLTQIGKIVDNAIKEIPNNYKDIFIDIYAIMPNHIHLIIRIDGDGRTMFAPTISRIIKQLKGVVTKQIGKPIWQKSFYEHIIRNEADYSEIWQYIENNPLKWELDKYYEEQ